MSNLKLDSFKYITSYIPPFLYYLLLMDDSNIQEDQPDEQKKQGSIIMGIIAQLRKGSDLSKVTLPTFVLEVLALLVF